jgi:acylaminoacyl-peptidase
VAFGGGPELRDGRRFTAVNPDGREVEAWAIEPQMHSGEHPPAVLHVHGGPNSMDGYRYSPEKQALAAAGYLVVFSNPRGSTGYAESWARAVRGKHAAVDPGLGFGAAALADLLAVVDQAVTQFGVDSERLGITGTSYGGFMTAGHQVRSDRFKVCQSRLISRRSSGVGRIRCALAQRSTRGGCALPTVRGDPELSDIGC